MTNYAQSAYFPDVGIGRIGTEISQFGKYRFAQISVASPDGTPASHDVIAKIERAIDRIWRVELILLEPFRMSKPPAQLIHEEAFAEGLLRGKFMKELDTSKNLPESADF